MDSSGANESRYAAIKEVYQQKSKHYINLYTKASKQFNVIAWIRLVAFVALIALPILIFPVSTIAGLLVIIACIAWFVFLIRKSNQLKQKKEEYDTIHQLNEDEIKALDYDWGGFPNGKKYINPEHHYSYDVDLFGEGSFFQYINRTVTVGGENYLAKHLSTEHLDANQIEKFQNALKDLAGKIEFRQHFYGKGKVIHEKKRDASVINDLEHYQNLFLNKSIFFKWMVKILPVITIGFVIASFFESKLVTGITILVLLNLLIVSAFVKRVNALTSKFSVLAELLGKYSILMELLGEEKFSNELSIDWQNKLQQNGQSVSAIIKTFANDLMQLDQRSGVIGGVILNGLFLWDIRYILKIEKWISQNSSVLNQSLNVLYEADAFCSMAGYVYNHPDYVWPTISASEVLNAQEMGHPLIPRQKRICNSYDFKDSTFALITGANMSGKSTFLRTIVLNRILAQSGMTVCAESMRLKPMVLLTNMRTSDNLLKNESYFFAELKRLKFIIDTLYRGIEVFVVLDEILKGTNSKDKTYGSMEMIRHLLQLKAYGMIATHDLELGVLEEESDGKVQNICFEVKNDKDKLHFDYKLYRGVTQNHNATFLMKQMNIIINS